MTALTAQRNQQQDSTKYQLTSPERKSALIRGINN